MRTIMLLLTFGIAIWAINGGWVALRTVWVHPSTAGLAITAGYAVVFGVAFLSLGFWIYRADRAAGKVRRRIRLYERFLSKGREDMKGGIRDQGLGIGN